VQKSRRAGAAFRYLLLSPSASVLQNITFTQLGPVQRCVRLAYMCTYWPTRIN